MHCESGDVLIDDVMLPSPRRGDLLAVPATGAYTLAMASNYNGVPRPAAVLVRGGSARLIRRRETIEDLLRAEVE
jgi:diaminopimelate decarboxylase